MTSKESSVIYNNKDPQHKDGSSTRSIASTETEESESSHVVKLENTLEFLQRNHL